MSVKVNIHKTHRSYTDGLEVVAVEGKTVGDCLKHLVQRYPGMKEGLFDKKGKLLNVVEVYVNNESAYPEELAKAVEDGDEIQLILMLSGG
ncbi:MAG: MoaD/ThiS family protein [Desulfobacteraceae bacterium]